MSKFIKYNDFHNLDKNNDEERGDQVMAESKPKKAGKTMSKSTNFLSNLNSDTSS